MREDERILYRGIVRDMSEGVVAIGLDGVIRTVNDACARILGLEQNIEGRPFASVFFEHQENDAFNQVILDAIYEKSTARNSAVDFRVGERVKKLFLTASYIVEAGERQGVVVVINDVSELYELKDAIRAMERIKALNERLEMRNKLISDTFGRYLSDEIVRDLLDTPNGLRLGGQKQTVTVLMSDLRGFTAMSERMPAAELIDMLNRYLGEMTEIVQSRGGTIIEFIGDAIFAIFGAPIASKQPEQNAAICAIEMQSRMTDVNRYNAEHGYPTLEMGIGVNTGEVILGNIGSLKRAKYGVVGSEVNLCGRIESYTVGGQVLVSEATFSRLTGAKTRGEMQILPKGVPVPITVYDLIETDGARLEVEAQVFRALEPPLEAPLYVLDGKFMRSEPTAVHILALSRKQMKLDADFPRATNVKLIVSGREVFAKYVAEGVAHITAGSVL